MPPRISVEDRIREIIQEIISSDGLTKAQIKEYYKDELGFNLRSKSIMMMIKRDINDLLALKIIWFNERNNSNLYTINKNFGFPLDSPYDAAGIYTIFFFGFKKGIITKNNVLKVINPSIFDYIGEPYLDF